MLVNDQVHGQVTPERALEIVNEIVDSEKEEVPA
jgi:NADH:ubiquinone oxidoreductase subunit E